MRKRTLWWTMLTALVAALFCAAYPIYVIRPFRFQGARELAAALAVLQYRNLASSVCAIAAVAAAVAYWRSQSPSRPHWAKRAGAVVMALFTCVFAGSTHVNVYEIMFHPLGAPAVEDIAATKLEADEMVLSVNLNGEARAYPVRSIAYHHIVNDTVGSVPIVATY